MGFVAAIKSCFRKYVTFSGRASRSEFWWFVLFIYISAVMAVLLDEILFAAFGLDPRSVGYDTIGLFPFWQFVLILPQLAVTVRRLHDNGRSGWWWFLMLVPFGGIWLLVWYCSRGTPGPNRYGPDPLASATNWPIAQL